MVKIHHSSDKMEGFVRNFISIIGERRKNNIIKNLIKKTTIYPEYLDFINWFIDNYIKTDKIFQLSLQKMFFLKENIKKTVELIGNESDMDKIQEVITNLFTYRTKKGNNKALIFNYTSAQSEISSQIVRDLEIFTCPYCNINPIHFSKEGEKRYGINLDHFYDKDTYPFLALSFYNLIPSCYSCNSSLKGSNHFCITTHLHPYEKGFEDVLSFEINSHNIESIISFDNINFDIDFDEYLPSEHSDTICGLGNIKDFDLHGQYQTFPAKKTVRDIIDIYESYPKGRASYSVNGLNEGEEKAILRRMLGVVEVNDFHTRQFSKLRRDIVKQYYPELLE